MRGDSKELMDLSTFYLEGKPDDTFRFKSGCFAGPVDGQMDGEIEFMRKQNNRATRSMFYL